MASKTVSVMTEPFRAAFVTVVEPEAGPEEGSKKKYSIVMLFDKSTGESGIMAIRKALFEAAKAKWGDDRAKWPLNMRGIDFKTHVSVEGKDGFPIRDGDTVTWDGFGGCWFVKASTNGEGPKARPPFLVDSKRVVILDRSVLESGMICRARVSAAAYESARAKGVTLYLEGLQILKDDGVRFSGRVRAEEAFDEWEDPETGGFDDSAF